MKEDVAGNVHRKLYGMSDKINAPENQNREFQEGYRVGAGSMAYSAELVLRRNSFVGSRSMTISTRGSMNGSGVSAPLAASALSSFPLVCVASATNSSGRLPTNENSDHIGNYINHSISV